MVGDWHILRTRGFALSACSVTLTFHREFLAFFVLVCFVGEVGALSLLSKQLSSLTTRKLPNAEHQCINVNVPVACAVVNLEFELRIV